MAPIRSTAASCSIPAMPLRDALAQRDGAFGAAVDATLLARLDLKPGARLTLGGATIEVTTDNQERAGQARRRHRLRAARDRQRSGVARHRSAAAGQPGALALSAALAGRQRPRRCRRHRCGRHATARCRLGDPQPHQRLAGAGAQRRALHPISHAGRADRAAGRRRRRRQRGEEPSRPQARRDRDVEGAGRNRRPRVRDLSVAGDAAVG